MNTDLTKKKKMILKNMFFRLMNNVVFGKIMEKLRRHMDIKLVTSETKEGII